MRKVIFATLMLTASMFGQVTNMGPISATQVNGVYNAARYSGANFCAKVLSAITALPAAGGVVDAQELSVTPTCTADLASTVGSKSVRVILPVGVITSSATWTIPSNFTLLGQGSNKTTIKFTGSAAGFNSVGATNWQIRDLKIDTTGTTSHWAIQSDSSSSGQVIDNVSVLGAATLVNPNGYVQLSGSDISIRNSTFNQISFIYCLQCSGGEISNNTFYNALTGIFLSDATGTSDRYFSVRGNLFLSAFASTQNGFDSVLVGGSRYVNIESNIIKAAAEHCIYVSDGAASSDITIANNTCTGWGAGAGIQVRGNSSGGGTYNQNITLTGNVCRGNLTSAEPYCYLLAGNRNLIVEGNTAKGAQIDGFYIENIVGGTFTGNTSTQNNSAGFRISDSLNTGAFNGLTFTGNIATNNNLDGNGFVGFHVQLIHAYANKQLHYFGNYAANDLPVAAISAIVRASNVVTVTTSVPHLLLTGTYSRLIITGVTDSSFNATLGNTAVTVIDSTHYSYPQTAVDATSSGGTIEAKSQVYGIAQSLAGSATLDVQTLEGNYSSNLVVGTFNTLVGTICGITDMSDGKFDVRSCSGSGSVVASIDTTGKGTFNGGSQIGTNGTAVTQFQMKNGVTGCATAASVGATCTTVVTWPAAFADNGYIVGCLGSGLTSGVPMNGGLTARSTTTVTFQTVAGTAGAAQYTTIECTGWHP